MKKPFTIAQKCKGPKCQAFACKNNKQPRSRFCSRHRKIMEKERDPVGYAYRVTKQNARRRGKDWSITYEEWREFCARTGYHEKKGRGPGGASIDRIDARRGYSIDNIRIFDFVENSRKGATEDKAPF